jgi:pantoate--beta-alanine ligase
MEILRTAAAMTAWSNKKIINGETICLVPTMGFFHAGHLALMAAGRKLADHVVVTLFVNPIQFGENEDLDSYPHDFKRDCQLAGQEGVAVMFAPEAAEMYQPGFQTRVTVENLSLPLCGADRPGHFNGVTTVVAKLFNLVKPKFAVFGEKDFQQLAVIRRMVLDLNWDIEIIGHPIVREADGLAMSSRNSYLNAEERRTALCLSMSLKMARQLVAQGENSAAVIIAEIKNNMPPAASVDYVSIVQADTLADSNEINQNSILALAVKIGKTRLIDNGRLVVQ